MPSRLEKQVRRIVDDADGGRVSVIIRMENPSKEEDAFVRAAARVLRQRNLSLTARDCLPADRAPRETDTHATPPPLLEDKSSMLKGSLSAQSKGGFRARGSKELRDQSRERLEPLLENDRVDRALRRKEGGREDADRLWASTSLTVELTGSDLSALPDEVDGIAEVYANRPLRIPPVVEAANLPDRVRESRASSYGVRLIGALAAWGAYGARGKGVRVGVLDTGVDASHPDLEGKVVAWAEFDAEGRIVPGSEPHDADRHGTHVSGTIAGGNTSGQWIGVAPEAELCCAKVLGKRGGTDAQIQAGMSWALEQRVDVISMSIGGLILGPEMPGTYTEAIVKSIIAGVPVVIAIGNEGAQLTGSPGSDLFAFSVGATDHKDRPAGFSGGRTQIVYESDFIDPQLLPTTYSKPDVSAPGVAVISSVPRKKWAPFNGTSMATPHVAGAMAVLLSATNLRSLPADERALTVSDLITGSVEELGESGQDHRFGFGRIDVLRAIDFAKERGY